MAVKSYFIYPVWILLYFTSAMKTENCSEMQKEAIIHHQIHQGLSTTINCHYYKNISQYLEVSLRIKQFTICKYMYGNQSWTEHFCNDNIRFLNETEELSFQLLNLQLNNSDIYTCNVMSYVPPPTRCIGQKRIYIHVQASPLVSVSCEKGSGGSLIMLCTCEGFYPHELQQVWLRGEKHTGYQNSSVVINTTDVNWTYRKNKDGTSSVASYLHLSSTSSGVYYCWVNHSSLSQPIIFNISSTECTETLTVADSLGTGISCGVIAAICLFLAGCYKCCRRRISIRSKIEEAPVPEPVSHSILESQRSHQSVPDSIMEDHQHVSHTYSNLGTYHSVPEVYSTLEEDQGISHTYSNLDMYQSVPEVYSTLGSHQPVPCRDNSNGSACLISIFDTR